MKIMDRKSLREQITQVLENTSASFLKLRAIESWNTATLWANLGVIVQASKDWLETISELKEVFGSVVHDSEAQDELAEILDEAMEFNALLEAVDGMIFKLVIKAACTALAPFVDDPAGNPEREEKEVTA